MELSFEVTVAAFNIFAAQTLQRLCRFSVSSPMQPIRIFSDLVAEHRSRLCRWFVLSLGLATSSPNVCSDTVAWAVAFVLPPLSLRLGRSTSDSFAVAASM